MTKTKSRSAARAVNNQIDISDLVEEAIIFLRVYFGIDADYPKPKILFDKRDVSGYHFPTNALYLLSNGRSIDEVIDDIGEEVSHYLHFHVNPSLHFRDLELSDERNAELKRLKRKYGKKQPPASELEKLTAVSNAHFDFRNLAETIGCLGRLAFREYNGLLNDAQLQAEIEKIKDAMKNLGKDPKYTQHALEHLSGYALGIAIYANASMTTQLRQGLMLASSFDYAVQINTKLSKPY